MKAQNSLLLVLVIAGLGASAWFIFLAKARHSDNPGATPDPKEFNLSMNRAADAVNRGDFESARENSTRSLPLAGTNTQIADAYNMRGLANLMREPRRSRSRFQRVGRL